jgi:hypothetical protein
MKRIILGGVFLGLSIFYSGCSSIVEGRPEANNINQSEGSYTWWDTRQNYEFNASQFNDQFGDQPGDANDNRTDAVNTDNQDFNYN